MSFHTGLDRKIEAAKRRALEEAKHIVPTAEPTMGKTDPRLNPDPTAAIRDCPLNRPPRGFVEIMDELAAALQADPTAREQVSDFVFGQALAQLPNRDAARLIQRLVYGLSGVDAVAKLSPQVVYCDDVEIRSVGAAMHFTTAPEGPQPWPSGKAMSRKAYAALIGEGPDHFLSPSAIVKTSTR